MRAWAVTQSTVRPHRAAFGGRPLGYLKADHPERMPLVPDVLNPYTRLTAAVDRVYNMAGIGEWCSW
ncbi:MAG: hypothetical protein C4315_03870 [Chloroflexota bacterium]